MKKLFTLITLLIISLGTSAQIRGFGNIDTADLRSTSCDFEKDANAEVLFNYIHVYYKFSTVVMEYHKRIKIFNDKGYDAAKVRIKYYGVHNDESVSDLQAETINMNNGAIEYKPVDKSIIFTQNIDNDTKAITFTFPDLKPGSIVEFKYKLSSYNPGAFPDWYFDGEIPVRYSEFKAEFSRDYTFKFIKRIHQKFATDTSYFTNGKNINHGMTYIWALNDVHSVKQEPYMTAMRDNIQHILFQVTGGAERTWLNIVKGLMSNAYFGSELDMRIELNDEDKIVDKIKSLPAPDEKIAYVYNLVKGSMKYNDLTGIYTDNEIKRVWNKKEGTAPEINFIVYHFLKKAGIDVSLLIVNTQQKIEQYYASTYQMNRTICYVKTDSTKVYILDASYKDGKYNEIPYYLLNSNGLLINPVNSDSRFIDIQNAIPARKIVYINADITPDGKMTGTAQISSFSYNRASVIKKYKDDGEKKYMDYLRDDNNNLKISAFKIDNMEVDSLPLTQNIDFNLDLIGSDENYIYFSPNLFTEINSNAFLSEERFSDIDFKYLNNYNISGRYKIPAGYRIDALPKSMSILMPDKSISFKRIVAEDEGYVIVHYTINFKRSYYLKDEYPDIKAYYKKMHEMLNEQIILKKYK